MSTDAIAALIEWADNFQNQTSGHYDLVVRASEELAAIEAAAPEVERLTRALRVATHSPHDQDGEPNEGFPVCSVCGAIQTSPAAPRPEGLDVERLQKALVWCVPNGTDDVLGSPDDLARAIAREYQRLSGTGDTPKYPDALNTDLAGDETSPPHRPDCLCSVCYVKRP